MFIDKSEAHLFSLKGQYTSHTSANFTSCKYDIIHKWLVVACYLELYEEGDVNISTVFDQFYLSEQLCLQLLFNLKNIYIIPQSNPPIDF